ncbi:MarR family transcriptional regulator [Aeromicrobium camelliae]|uniref:MarR family transcriptional regulator n=1 Tax=Aeromicrobium camelliae TaxID=1538144 RepID=A0A3N6WCX3_9ACTN|nr:MarR family transcriptional regulator [Aeromicrobium camelliae]RQN02872.1 MarR family transcriptional regulator [Aeromicrobium camelliae]
MNSADPAPVLRELSHVLVRRTPRGSLSRAGASTLSQLERCGPQRITVLAEREAVSQPAMTNLVQRLEGAGLVRRETDPDDARASRISITEAGLTTLSARRRLYDELIGATLDKLDDAERAAISSALPALTRFIEIHDHQH